MVCFGFEADDGLGMNYKKGDILSHIDKDINQIPGTHINWKTLEIYEVGEQEGEEFFFQQLLTGDKTDNIPPCPYNDKSGYGPARAKKALKDCVGVTGHLLKVVEIYKDKFGTNYLTPLLEVADLVFMGRRKYTKGHAWMLDKIKTLSGLEEVQQDLKLKVPV